MRGALAAGISPIPASVMGASTAPVAGDITAARVNSDGWTLELDILGFKVGGNVNRGRDTNGAYPGSGSVTVGYPLNPYTTPIVALGVTGRSGFDASTGAAVANLTETVLGTISKRKAYTVGGAEQTNDETDNTTYITIRLALDKRVMSGETVTLTALADLYRDNGSGGSSAQSRAVTGLAVTNNSAVTGKKPVCGYLTVPRQLLYQDKDFEFGAAHGWGRSGRMCAAVVMTWTGATSGVVVTKTVTTMVLSTFLRTDMPRVCVFKATLTTAEIATFTQAEQINWSCASRPFVGLAYVASTDGTAFPTPRMAQSLPFVCDKNNSLRAFATVDPSGALTSASTAGCSLADQEQTLTANCYATHNAALTALKNFMGRSESAGAVIYTRAGTYATLGNTNTTAFTFGTHWVLITHAPSTNRAGVIFTTTAGQSIVGNDRRMGAHVHFYDVTMTTLANATSNDNVLLNGPDSTSTPTKGVWVDQCLVTSLSTHATPSSCFSGHGQQYFTNNYLTGKVRMTISSGRGFYLIAGNEFDNAGIVNVHGPFVGNYGHGGTQFQQTDPAAANVVFPIAAFYCFNKFSGADPITVGWFTGTITPALSEGVARVQNLTENWNNATQAAFNVSADGDTTVLDNEVDAYNTAVGERTNWMYNSTGTVAIVKDGIARFNIYYQRFIKRDTFSDPTNGKQAGRTGNWISSHGVDGYGSVTLVAQFGVSVCSSNSDIGDFWPGGATVGTVTFTDDKSGSLGAGGGTYTLTGVSNDAYACVPSGLAMLPFDIAGTARLNGGTGAAGAYERS